ncbi:phosphatase PAP2 family protein [Litchfieldia alkalitelluris]|uniref:phosphatase PAP2 family protein n=1 Tax=Litchfieldia alkalitelluris TaxID=304268 RepID=UPI000998812F|nr:phosphatase PAP2 family protein [Litchfieldia alkalitelluris]
MLSKILIHCYTLECQLFHQVNRHYDIRMLNRLFTTLTHLGGATFTIAITLIIALFAPEPIRIVGIVCAISLALSHIPVAIIKKKYPRLRPYLVLEQSKHQKNPLKDHSFPSGHTTAVFSVVIPIIMMRPSLAIILLPLACLVAISRVYLGLHYPSDILVGGLLGSTVAFCVYFSSMAIFPSVFLN